MGINIGNAESELARYLINYGRLKKLVQNSIINHLVPLLEKPGNLSTESIRAQLRDEEVHNSDGVADVKIDGLSVKFFLIGSRCDITFTLLPTKNSGYIEWNYYKQNVRTIVDEKISVFKHKFDDPGNITIDEKTGETTTLGENLKLYLLKFLPQLIEEIDKSR